MQQVGPYVLEAELGRGGMGVVWRAHDPALDRTVALKVLLQPLASVADLERFRREAQAQARLRHPSIAGVHGCGTTQAGQPYLVLDYIDGQSLANRLRAGPLPVAEASRLVAALARALSYAHGQGVLHRDLKARNVMLAVDGDPVLLDFGLAAVTGAQRLTATGETLGTPGCLAPEQALGDRERIGPRTDVYGLGVVLHEALTGRPPFEGREVVKLLADVVERPASPPSRVRPGLDPRLDAIVLRCLEKDPARRWPTAQALAEALDELGRGPPATTPRRLAGLAVALALGATALGAWARGRDRRPDPSPSIGAVPSTAAVDTAGRVDELTSGLVRSAREAIGRGDLRAALADLDRAVALSPAIEAVSARALTHVALGDQDGARRDLQDLGRRAEPEALVHAARGLALTCEPEALEVAERAVAATAGQSGRALGARALAHALRNERLEALADAAAAARLEPDEVLALLAEGACAPDRGLAAFERAIELAERAGDHLARAAASTALAGARVSTLLTADDPSLERALAELDEALRLAPALRPALHQRATLRIALDRGGIDRALADAALLARLHQGQDPTAIELLVYLRARRALDPARGLDREEASRALADLGTGLAQLPGSAVLLGARAELRVALGDLVGAEDDAQAALQAEEAPGIADRAIALLARLRGRRGATAEGLALVNAFIEARGKAPYSLAERALLQVQLGDAKAAAADAQRALGLERTLVRGHYARARAHLLSSTPADLAEAKRALQEAVRLSPGFAQARGDLALVLFTLGELSPGKALQALREAGRLQPWAAEHPCNEAQLAELVGDQAAADAALERALALDPAFLPARFHRGSRRVRIEPRVALADLQLVVERQPGSGDAWTLLAVARRDLRDDDGALLAVSQALSTGSRLRPLTRATALRLRAGVRLERGEGPGALADASLAVTLDPASSDGWWYRGRARAVTDDPPGALADFDAALERSPENGDCRLDRAELLLRGDPPARERARAELERLLEGLPEGAQRRRALALLGRGGG